MVISLVKLKLFREGIDLRVISPRFEESFYLVNFGPRKVVLQGGND